MKKIRSFILLCVAVILASCQKSVTFSNLTANGSTTETTTTLTFDKAIEELSADDLFLTAGETGAVKGTLTAQGGGVYQLAVSGITQDGEVTVTVAKSSYALTPVSKSVAVMMRVPDVYVAGFEKRGTNRTAILWKNGVPIDLTDGTDDAYASSVYVMGSDVYVAGMEYYGAKQIAKVWKNGEPTALTDGTNDAYAYSVFVK